MKSIQIASFLIAVTMTAIAIASVWINGPRASGELLQIGFFSWFPILLITVITELVNLAKACFPPPDPRRTQPFKQK